MRYRPKLIGTKIGKVSPRNSIKLAGHKLEKIGSVHLFIQEINTQHLQCE